MNGSVEEFTSTNMDTTKTSDGRTSVKPVYCWPAPSNLNPYQILFYDALGKHRFAFQGGFELTNKWLEFNSSRAEILHFHWPEQAWRWRGAGVWSQFRAVFGLGRFLRSAKKRGIKLWWTVHNREHHEGMSHCDRLGYRLLRAYCDLLICHSEEVAEYLWEFGIKRNKVVVVPHGTYEGAYPTARPKQLVFEELGLNSSKRTICLLGMLRPYKGLDVVVEVAELLPDVQFIVAGNPGKDYDLSTFSEKFNRLKNCVFMDRFLSDQEFSDFANASDGFLLPYHDVTGSGALLAALTFGKGAVTSRLPYFENFMKSAPEFGKCFSTGSPNACATAIKDFFAIPSTLHQSAIRHLKQEYSWDKCVISLANRCEH